LVRERKEKNGRGKDGRGVKEPAGRDIEAWIGTNFRRTKGRQRALHIPTEKVLKEGIQARWS